MVFADHQFELNTSVHRIFVPAFALGKAGHDVTVMPIEMFQQGTPEAAQKLNECQVIVIERNFFADTISAMAFWKVRGKVIITNWDDAYHAITKTNASYSYWAENKVRFTENKVKCIDIEKPYPTKKLTLNKEYKLISKEGMYNKIQDDTGQEEIYWHSRFEDATEKKEQVIFPKTYDQFKWGVGLSYAATLPSREMCRYWKKYIPTYYMPNWFETDTYINLPKEKHEGIIIGWGGSLSHFESWVNSGLLIAMKNVFKLRPQVKIKICGDKGIFDKLDIPQEQKLFQSFISDIPKDRILFQPFVPATPWRKDPNHDKIPYYQCWADVENNFDIGVVPLSGEYDTFRSWIKPMELMLCKVPTLCSVGPAYQDIAQYTKLIRNDPQVWELNLLKMIDNLDAERERVAGAPYEFALKQDVNLHVDEIINIYKTIAKDHAGISL